MVRQSQVAVEFVILIAAVLIIFIPLVVFLLLTSFESHEQTQIRSLQRTAQLISDESRQMYFRGEFNSQRITVTFPDIVRNMTSIQYQDETYLFIDHGTGNVSVSSEVPIRLTYCNDVGDQLHCYMDVRRGMMDMRLSVVRIDGVLWVNITGE